MDYGYDDVAGMIDHSLLNPNLRIPELEAGIRLALDYQTASVCIVPHALPLAVAMLRGSGVRASTTIGFPHGGQSTAIKRAEAEEALAAGAAELDVVSNISRVRGGDWDYVAAEMHELTQTVHRRGQKIKVIFENCYLDDAAKIRLCEICSAAGVDWVKTSTGYGPGGATIEDLKLMRRHCPTMVGVKAAGGIRTLDALLEVRSLGVGRAGATRTAAMLDECRERLGLPPVPRRDAAAPIPAVAY